MNSRFLPGRGLGFRRVVAAFCAVLLSAVPVSALVASEQEGDQLYRVSTVRAAPGHMADLLEWARPGNGTRFFVARHSQGDHWDLMFVIPLAGPSLDDPLDGADDLIAFQEDVFAFGPPREDFGKAYASHGLVHIEMFAALPGKIETLLEQRRMENAYLGATGQVRNMIFRAIAGSDVDVFTIGFHEDFAAFGAAGPEDADAAEAAARAAGFKSRADIGLYLRSLLANHHDTLATTID